MTWVGRGVYGFPGSPCPITHYANYCAPKFPSPSSTRLPFHFPRGARLVSRRPCLCRIAVAVVVVCVEPRGPASPIGVLDIQMTAVMRREFGTAEPPSSEVELGRGRANGLVHVHCLPPAAVLFCPLFRLRFCAEPRNRTIEHYILPMTLQARESLRS